MENEKVLEEQIIKIKKFVDLYKLEEENSDTIIIDRQKYKFNSSFFLDEALDGTLDDDDDDEEFGGIESKTELKINDNGEIDVIHTCFSYCKSFSENDLEELERLGIPKDQETWIDAFRRIVRDYGYEHPEVYGRAGMSKQSFSKIFKPDYHPTKEVAIALSIGLELDLTEANEFLGKAGYCFTRTSNRDLVIMYHLIEGIYNVDQINIVLNKLELPLLKANSKTKAQKNAEKKKVA